MYSNSLLFGSLFALLFLISMALGVLLALKRGFFPTLVRLGMVALCFAIAIPITAAIAGPISGLTENIMTSVLGDTLDKIATYSPTTMSLVQQLPVALIAPLLFIVIFLLLSLITWIIFRFIKILLPKKSSLLFRLLGCVAGALTSLIGVYAVLIPLLGMVGMGHCAMQALAQAKSAKNDGLASTIAQVEQIDTTILGPAVCNFTSDLFTDEGDSALYRALTKIKLGEETASLGEEVKLVSGTASDALSFIGSLPEGFKLSDLNAQQIASLHTLTQDIDNSTLLKNICAEWISSMAQVWQDGQPFFGIADPAANTKIKPIAHTLYGFLSTTNAELLVNDLNTFLGLLEVLTEHGMLDMQNQASLLETIGNETFVNDLIATLDQNKRLCNTIADLIASMTGAWAAGTDYMGMAKPEVNELLTPVMQEVFSILSTTNGELLQDDLNTLVDIVGTLRKHDLMNTETPGSQIGDILMNGSFVADLTQAINKHERFKPLLNSVAGLGLSAISSQLSTALPDAPMIHDLSGSISNALNNVTTQDGTLRAEAVQQEIDKIITENKIDVPDGVTEMISDIVLERFKDQKNVSNEDVSDYLLDLYHSVGDLDGYFK